jgi:hypothetical protein
MQPGKTKLPEDKSPVIELFQKGMAKVDELALKYQGLLDAVGKLSCDLKSLSTKYELLSQSLTNLITISDRGIESNKSLARSALEGLKTLTDSHVQVKKETADVKAVIPELQAGVKSCSQFSNEIAKSVQSTRDDTKRDIFFINDNLRVYWEKLSEFQDEVKIKVQDLKSFLDAISKQSHLHENMMKEINKSFAQVPEILSYFKSENSRFIQSAKEEISSQVETRIASIPKPVIPSLDEAKTHMQAQLEPVVLDAKNAHLRSSNNESKITILEKKVEQLQLLVNKFQLKG